MKNIPPQDILDNNALIAEFMGAILGNGTDVFPIVYVNVPDFWSTKESSSTWAVEMLMYHCRYDWLMPVLEKISHLPNTLHPFGMFRYLVKVDLEVGTNYIRIEDMYQEGWINIEHFENSLITNIYNGCVEFIKWHNKQNHG